MRLNTIPRTLTILLIFWFSLNLGFNPEGLAMASRQIHFVDENAPATVTKDQPHNKRVLEGGFYRLSIGYPEDHRVKLPLRQMSSLAIYSKVKEPITFKISKWEVKDNNGQIFRPIIDRGSGHVTLDEILRKEEVINQGLFRYISAYYDIPPSVKRITIDLEIELTSPEGKKVLVKESIPLKQATFTTSFWEGWGR